MFICVRILLLGVLLGGSILMASAQKLLPATHYKSRILQEVCGKIARAKGDGLPVPATELISKASNSQLIAKFRAKPRATLVVDEKTYDLCTSFGRDSLNALACLIGHELAHYYGDHSWTYSFAGMGVKGGNPHSAGAKASLEAKADYDGMFYGILAGYETYQVLPRLLEAIYRTYGLPDQMPGYPSKQERIEIAREKVNDLMPLIQCYQAGQLLYLKKHFADAGACFDYVLSNFYSRETYSNAGVVKLAQAVELMDAKELLFAYPFELDVSSRMRKGLVRGTQSRQVDIDTLLNQAQHYFRQATSRDPSYTTGYINLACAYSLAGNQPFAIGIINDLEQKHRTDEVSLPGNAYLIRGIALAKNDQLEKARPDFETAVQKKAYQANYNLALYQELSPSWQDALSKNASRYWNWVATFWQQEAPPYKGGKEKGIGEITWSNLRTLPVANSLLLPPPGRPVKIVAVQGANVGGMLLQLSDYTLEIIVTGQTYTGKTLTGISVGSALAELLKQYGEPSYTVAGAGGSTYYCYNGAGIIFELQSERVKRWSISRIQY